MSKTAYIALSGAVAQEAALDATAANVANASTVGHQRVRPVFREMLAQAQGNGYALHYAAAPETANDTSQGNVRQTGRGLDVALPKGVYLAVSTARGERYTRAGSFVVGSDGSIKTKSGDAVLDESGAPMRATPGKGEPVVDAEGRMTQGTAGLGKLKLVSFAEPSKLEHEGASVLAVGGAGAPTPAVGAKVEPQAVEEANGDVVTSMTDLMTASRTFEAFQKILEQVSDIDRKAANTLPGATES